MGGRASRPLWVLVGDGAGEIVTVADGGDGDALLVFGFEEEATMYLRLLGGEGRWRVKEATAEGLAPLLRGPYAGVRKIALDPVPAGVNSSGPLDVAWASREDFLGAFGSEDG